MSEPDRWIFTTSGMKSRVPDQNGVSQAWYIAEIHHSVRKLSKLDQQNNGEENTDLFGVPPGDQPGGLVVRRPPQEQQTLVQNPAFAVRLFSAWVIPATVAALGMPESVAMNRQTDWQAQQISHLVCSLVGQRCSETYKTFWTWTGITALMAWRKEGWRKRPTFHLSEHYVCHLELKL